MLDNRKTIENIFKEMYDLKIEYRVYGKIIADSLINIQIYKNDNDGSGVEAWTNILNSHYDKQEWIKQRIKDLHAQAMKLKPETEL